MKKLLAIVVLALTAFVSAKAYEYITVDGIGYYINSDEKTLTVTYLNAQQEHIYYSGKITIPATVVYNGKEYKVVTIGNSAFKDCENVTSVSMPLTLTKIGDSAFKGCTGMYTATIGNMVTSIEAGAFAGCSKLMGVTIPSKVTKISSGAFKGCNNLTVMRVEDGNTMFDSRDQCNAIINKSSNKLVAGCKTTVIPASVTSIGEYAFADISELTEVSIPASIRSIERQAYSGCPLTSVTSLATTPPSLSADAFDDAVYDAAALNVPGAAVASYKSADNWKNFKRILNVDTVPVYPDVNRDGKVDVLDINIVINAVLGQIDY